MADSNRFARPTYSKDQLSKFYERIKLPQSVRDRINSPEWSPDWDTLETLQLYTVCSVPFECLSLHYSKDKKITIDANYLYKKIVEDDNGRGGYCMENNNLFGTVLRSIGYAAYPVGARVNSDTNEGDVPAVYFAWSHMVNVVLLHGQRYLVDVGFGANGPHHPLTLQDDLLEPDHPFQIQNVGPSQIRLVHEPIPDALNQGQKHWIVQHRYNKDARWITAYATPAIEFLPQDFEVMNHHTSHGAGLFTDNVICTLLLKDADEDKLVGDLTLFNYDLKERRNGESKLTQHFNTEEERRKGIEEYFGIHFSDEEAAGVTKKRNEK